MYGVYQTKEYLELKKSARSVDSAPSISIMNISLHHYNIENPQKTILNSGRADINGAHQNKPIQLNI